MTRVPRVIRGLTLAAGVSLVARSRGSLTTPGGLAATLIGGIAFAHGWQATLQLLTFFVTSTGLSHLPLAGNRVKPRRGATQVLANGGVSALCWSAEVLGLPGPWGRLASAAIATAAADTWATELGQRYGGTPRLVTTGKPVTPGTSGGVTAVGLLASLAGAVVIAVAGSRAKCIEGIVLAGVGGSLVDSLLGALVQARFQCTSCGTVTEHAEHCGGPAECYRGVSWMTNDSVNALATLAGAGLTMLLDRSRTDSGRSR